MKARALLYVVVGVAALIGVAIARKTALAAPPKVVTVTGSIVDNEGRQLVGVRLLVVPDGKRKPWSLRTEKDGQFKFVIEPGGGTFAIYASHSEFGVATLTGLAGYADQNIHFTLAPARPPETVLALNQELSAIEGLCLLSVSNRRSRVVYGSLPDSYREVMREAEMRFMTLAKELDEITAGEPPTVVEAANARVRGTRTLINAVTSDNRRPE